MIFKWHKRLADGRDSLADDEREGRPSLRESDAVKNEVRDVINGDRRLTVREVADKCGIPKTTAHQILGNDLNMNRVCARWVPRILTAEHLTKRVELSKQFIKKVNRGGIRFLDKIITTVESWFHVKIKSSHGGHLEFPISKRFTSLVQDHPMIIPAKSQFNWLSGF